MHRPTEPNTDTVGPGLSGFRIGDGVKDTPVDGLRRCLQVVAEQSPRGQTVGRHGGRVWAEPTSRGGVEASARTITTHSFPGNILGGAGVWGAVRTSEKYRSGLPGAYQVTRTGESVAARRPRCTTSRPVLPAARRHRLTAAGERLPLRAGSRRSDQLARDAGLASRPCVPGCS